MPNNPVKVDNTPNTSQSKQQPTPQQGFRVTVGSQSYLIDLSVTGIMYWKYLQIAISNPVAVA